MTTTLLTLPTPRAQAERLVSLGVHVIARLSAGELHDLAADQPLGTLLVLDPRRAPASALAPLLERDGKAGFVVVDMTDLDDFTPIETVTLPEGPAYVLGGLDRGDAMRNWSPDEARSSLRGVRRSPSARGSFGCCSNRTCSSVATAS